MDRGQTLDVVDTPAKDSRFWPRGLTLDVVDTPAKDRRFWPSIEDFQEPERTLRWREVQQGIYKVLEIHDRGQSKFGPSVVLKLESKDGKTFFAWAATSIVHAMKKRETTTFILNLGSKISDTTGSLFYDFKLH